MLGIKVSMAAARSQKNQKKPESRTILGFLFNPDIGTTLRPLRESTRLFINLLAMVFATQGLFPRNHPALTGAGDAPRLSLQIVLTIAWRNLSFTKDKIPQIILFFAVIAILAFSTLAMISVLLSLFIGQAHAQTWESGCIGTGFFSTCDGGTSGGTGGTSDIANNWLGYLFKDAVMPGYVNSYGIEGNSNQILPQAFIIQHALQAALATYSGAIMVVAGLLLFYHLVAMIINTAHDGVVMGKNANQVWAPIRLVFAVGLLVPMGNGLNVGQHIVIKIAELGSNMASTVWSAFLTQLVTEAGDPVAAIAPYARKAVYDTMMTQACMATYNAYLNGATSPMDTSGGGVMGNTVPAVAPSPKAATPYIPAPINASLAYSGSAYAMATTQLVYDKGGSAGTGTTDVTPFEYPALCSPAPLNAPIYALSGNTLNTGYDFHNATDYEEPDLAPDSGIDPALFPPIIPQGRRPNDGSYIVHFDLPPDFGSLSETGICGQYSTPPPQPYDHNDPVATAVANMIDGDGSTPGNAAYAFEGMVSNVQGYVAQYLPYFLPSCIGGKKGTKTPIIVMDGLDQIVLDYQSTLQGMINNQQTAFVAALQQAASTSVKQGWVSAGAWFNTIARAQSILMDVARAIPGTKGPDFAAAYNSDDPIFADYVVPDLAEFAIWVRQASAIDPSTLNGSTYGNLSSQQTQMALATASFAQSNDKSAHLLDKVFQVIDYMFSRNNVWQRAQSGSEVFTLGVQFRGANPMAEIVAFGQSFINAAYDTYDQFIAWTFGGAALAAIGEAAGKNAEKFKQELRESPQFAAFKIPDAILDLVFGTFGKFSGEAAAAIGAMFGLVVITFFAAGFMLVFMFPLIPFFRFFFGIVAWLMALMEAVIAVPLLALAHLTPEGDGLPGQAARQGYMYIFGLFVRPVLMVFGLMAGLLIFYIATSYMNMFFTVAIASTGGISNHHTTEARLVFSIMYVVVLYVMANTCFKMIDYLPDHALQWMGSSGLQYATDSYERIEQVGALAVATKSDEFIDGGGKAARGIGRGLGAAAGTNAASGGILTGLAAAGIAAPGAFGTNASGLIDDGIAAVQSQKSAAFRNKANEAGEEVFHTLGSELSNLVNNPTAIFSGNAPAEGKPSGGETGGNQGNGSKLGPSGT